MEEAHRDAELSKSKQGKYDAASLQEHDSGQAPVRERKQYAASDKLAVSIPALRPFVLSRFDKSARSDFVLMCGGHHFNVHLLLLQGHDFFNKLTKGHFAEACKKEAEFPDEDPGVFELMLGWIYGASLEDHVALQSNRPTAKDSVEKAAKSMVAAKPLQSIKTFRINHHELFIPTREYVALKKFSADRHIISLADYHAQTYERPREAVQHLYQELRLYTLTYVAADKFQLLQLRALAENHAIDLLCDCWGSLQLLDVLDETLTALADDFNRPLVRAMVTGLAERLTWFVPSSKYQELLANHPMLGYEITVALTTKGFPPNNSTKVKFCTWYECRKNCELSAQGWCKNCANFSTLKAPLTSRDLFGGNITNQIRELVGSE